MAICTDTTQSDIIYHYKEGSYFNIASVAVLQAPWPITAAAVTIMNSYKYYSFIIAYLDRNIHLLFHGCQIRGGTQPV